MCTIILQENVLMLTTTFDESLGSKHHENSETIGLINGHRLP